MAPETETKYEADGDAVLGNRVPAPPARPGSPQTAADVVTAYLREHADKLLALDPVIRR
jgi:hypothetical protein